jgi:hypothetical protein
VEQVLVLLLAVRLQVVAHLNRSTICLGLLDELDLDGAVPVGDHHGGSGLVAADLDDVALGGVVVLVALVGAGSLAALLVGLPLPLLPLVIGTVVAGVGLLRFTKNVSAPSSSASEHMVTGIVYCVCDGGKVSVPLVVR